MFKILPYAIQSPLVCFKGLLVFLFFDGTRLKRLAKPFKKLQRVFRKINGQRVGVIVRTDLHTLELVNLNVPICKYLANHLWLLVKLAHQHRRHYNHQLYDY